MRRGGEGGRGNLKGVCIKCIKGTPVIRMSSLGNSYVMARLVMLLIFMKMIYIHCNLHPNSHRVVDC